MCEPTTIGLVIAGLSVALSATGAATSAVIANRQADNQERLADAQFSHEKKQAEEKSLQLAEQSALERQQIAEEAARARGVAKTAGLGAQSLRSFLLDVSRKEGRTNAVIDRNLELVAQNRQAMTQGSLLSLSGKVLDIDSNRPNYAVLGLQIGARVGEGYVQHKKNNPE